MTDVNLPVPIHSRGSSTEVAVREAPGGFEIGGEDIRPPRMKVCQDPKTQAANFGDVFVQTSSDDPNPVVIQDNADVPAGILTDPVRFYCHSSRRGVNFYMPEHPDAGYNGMVLGPWHVTVAEFLRGFPHEIDATKVYRKYDFLLTVPDYPALPVQFLMASSWGGAAAAELNKQIRLIQAKGGTVSDFPFQVQFRSTNNDKGTFMKAFVGVGDVPQGTVEEDQEVVEEHATLLPQARLEDDGVPSTGHMEQPGPDLS